MAIQIQKFKILIPLFLFCTLIALQNMVFNKERKISQSIWFDVVRAGSDYPKIVHFFSAGSIAAVSDLTWIQALQTHDYVCPPDKQQKGCNSTFSKLTLLSLKLDPRNSLAARSGLLISDVIIRDIEGGEAILNEGIIKNTSDWRLNYYGGYHFLEENVNFERAAHHFYQAAQLGGPRWLYALSAQLYSKSGHLELAQRFLEEQIRFSEGTKYHDRLVQRLDEIKAKYAQDRVPATNANAVK